jgi:hypothetical protein
MPALPPVPLLEPPKPPLEGMPPLAGPPLVEPATLAVPALVALPAEPPDGMSPPFGSGVAVQASRSATPPNVTAAARASRIGAAGCEGFGL